MLLHAALTLVSPAGRQAGLSILIFHRVLPKPDPLLPGEVDAQCFDILMGWVKDWFNVLPLTEAVERLQRCSLPTRAATITFDDGYADNHDVALPILQQHSLPATFFIAAGFLDGGRMFNDTVIETVRRCAQPNLDLTQLGLGRYDVHSIPAKHQAIPALLSQIKYQPLAQRLDTVNGMAEIAQVTLPDDLMMTAQQVKALHEAGMGIGAHTMHHPILARLEQSEAEQEIATSREYLQALLGQSVTLFAYPNGKPETDYRREHVEIAQRLGFKAAVSTAWGVAQSDSDLFQLPRFTPWERQHWRFGLSLLRNYARKPATCA
ncbi:MAG: polysaccharide deacetylase family protein [Gammaproteobacteria bacterium]|nr:polysaccharide deacetylase family protein [Gammaproteobacteria bacterium]MCP5196486.1 polysaccharide deacetylase family protein [Gammaproteobacteria bacterium]